MRKRGGLRSKERAAAIAAAVTRLLRIAESGHAFKGKRLLQAWPVRRRCRKQRQDNKSSRPGGGKGRRKIFERLHEKLDVEIVEIVYDFCYCDRISNTTSILLLSSHPEVNRGPL